MAETKFYLGILGQIKLKEKDGKSIHTSWIESPLIKTTYFQDTSLVKKEEIKNIKEGVFVIFELKRGRMQVAFNCSLDCNKYIIENILNHQPSLLRFILKHIDEDLKNALIVELKRIEYQGKTPSLIEKIRRIIEVITIDLNIPVVKSEINESPEIIKSSTSFLKNIFQLNNSDYNKDLLNTLVKGIKFINDEDTFEQIKFLLSFDKQTTTNRTEELSSIFYQKANDEYKFRCWLEGIVDYCSPQILHNHFINATMDLKTLILSRFKNLESSFIARDEEILKLSQIEKVYFSDILSKISKELNNAKSSIQIAIAWFTNHVLFNILCAKLKEGLNIELILIDDYINNWEYGLPFKKFIELGGILYLSQYPKMMHHKFCLIDNDTILNGSYNWTYYAEKNNDENVMFFKGKPILFDQFSKEFKRLRTELIKVDEMPPYNTHELLHFERHAFKNYISSDLDLKAKIIKNENILYSSKLIDEALNLNPENEQAIQFKQEIASEVKLEGRINYINDKHLNNELIIIEENSLNEIQNTFKTNIGQKNEIVVEDTVKTNKQNLKDQPMHSVPLSLKTKSTLSPVQSISQSNDNIPKIIPSSSIINNNFSIPTLKPIQNPFHNLKIALVLDTSSSMLNLYKNGTMQQVLEKSLAVALSLSSSQQLDVWTFNSTTTRLSPISRKDFPNYIINNKIITNGNTYASKAIIDVDKKYFEEENGNSNIFTIIITDGDVDSLQSIIKKSVDKPIFWQFIGLGSKFNKLEELNKNNKNVGFFDLTDIGTIDDTVLFDRLLFEFPKWYKQSEIEGILKLPSL